MSAVKIVTNTPKNAPKPEATGGIKEVKVPTGMGISVARGMGAAAKVALLFGFFALFILDSFAQKLLGGKTCSTGYWAWRVALYAACAADHAPYCSKARRTGWPRDI